MSWSELMAPGRRPPATAVDRFKQRFCSGRRLGPAARRGLRAGVDGKMRGIEGSSLRILWRREALVATYVRIVGVEQLCEVNL
ncbi:hypothetical protein N9L68_05715 [bacterium]|nr:hypothetical protein [bacterium]